MPSDTTLASRLRSLRGSAGLTQQQVADGAGLTRAYVSRLEWGRQDNPSLDVVCRLARALGCSVEKLIS